MRKALCTCWEGKALVVEKSRRTNDCVTSRTAIALSWLRVIQVTSILIQFGKAQLPEQLEWERFERDRALYRHGWDKSSENIEPSGNLVSKCSAPLARVPAPPLGAWQGFWGPNYPRPSFAGPFGGCSSDTPARHSKLWKEPRWWCSYTLERDGGV